MQIHCDLVQRLHQELLQEHDCKKHDYGREVDAHGGDWKSTAHKPEHRLCDAVQESHDGVVGVGIHPGDQGGNDDNPHVDAEDYVEHPSYGADQITQNKHVFSRIEFSLGWTTPLQDVFSRDSTFITKTRYYNSSKTIATPSPSRAKGETAMALDYYSSLH